MGNFELFGFFFEYKGVEWSFWPYRFVHIDGLVMIAKKRFRPLCIRLGALSFLKIFK